MSGVDKGWQPFAGKSLIEHALRRLAPQVDAVAINANRNLAAYEALGVPVWPDGNADFAGPLAGFLAGLTHAQTPYVLTVACDTPLFPTDLATRLSLALQTAKAEIAVAWAPDNAEQRHALRPQPVFCLLNTTLRASLSEFIASGERKVGAWLAQHPSVAVPFDQAHDDPAAFVNLNTLDELQTLENVLLTRASRAA